MKTTYYTYTTWEEAMASGFGGGAAGSRQGMLTREPEREVRRADTGKVIDLNAWRAANLDELQAGPQDELDEAEWADEAPDEPGLVLPAPRPRRDHRRVLAAAELASTLAVVGTTAALMLRVLLF